MLLTLKLERKQLFKIEKVRDHYIVSLSIFQISLMQINNIKISIISQNNTRNQRNVIISTKAFLEILYISILY